MITLATPVPTGLNPNWQATCAEVTGVSFTDATKQSMTVQANIYSDEASASAGMGAVTGTSFQIPSSAVPQLAAALAALEVVAVQQEGSPLYGGTVAQS